MIIHRHSVTLDFTVNSGDDNKAASSARWTQQTCNIITCGVAAVAAPPCPISELQRQGSETNTPRQARA